MPHSRYQAETLLSNFWRGIPPPTAPLSLFVSLHDASNTELTQPGYARMEIASTEWTAAISDAITTRIQNTVPVLTPFASADWPPIHTFRVFDAESAGNPMTGFEPVTDAPILILNGERAVFPANLLEIVWPSTL